MHNADRAYGDRRNVRMQAYEFVVERLILHIARRRVAVLVGKEQSVEGPKEHGTW